MYEPAARFVIFYRTPEEKQQRMQLFLGYIAKWEGHEPIDHFPLNTKVIRDGYEVYHEWEEAGNQDEVFMINIYLFARIISEDIPINTCIDSHRQFFAKLIDDDVADVIQYQDLRTKKERKWLFFKKAPKICIGNKGFILIDMLWSILQQKKEMVSDEIDAFVGRNWHLLREEKATLAMTKKEGRRFLRSSFDVLYLAPLWQVLNAKELDSFVLKQ